MSLPYTFPDECLHATTFDNWFWCTFFRFLWILVHLPHQIDSNIAKTPRTGPSAQLVLEVWGWVLTNFVQPSACSSSFDIECEVRMFSRRSNLCSAVFPRACPDFFHFSAPLIYDTAPISKLDSGALFPASSGIFSRWCGKSLSLFGKFSQWISNRKVQTISWVCVMVILFSAFSTCSFALLLCGIQLGPASLSLFFPSLPFGECISPKKRSVSFPFCLSLFICFSLSLSPSLSCSLPLLPVHTHTW